MSGVSSPAHKVPSIALGMDVAVENVLSPEAVAKSTPKDKSAASSVSGNVSLVKIRLTTDEDNKHIVYEPSLVEIDEVIRGVLENFFMETDDITGVGEQLFPLLLLKPFHLTGSTKSLRDSDKDLIRVNALLDEVLDNNMKEVGEIPESPEQLQSIKVYADSVPKRLEQLANDFDEITQIVQLLSHFEYVPDESSFKIYWSTFARPRQVDDALDDFTVRYKEYRNRFMAELRDNTENLTGEINAIKRRVEALSYEDDEEKEEKLYHTGLAARPLLREGGGGSIRGA
eukprot:gene57462-biopygen16660